MKTKRSGFTIVELLIYAGILIVFLYVMTSMFTGILDMQLTSESASAVVQDSRYILSRFAYDIGRASAIVSPASLGAQTSSLILTIGSAEYTYALINGNLMLTAASSSGALNGYGTAVSNLSFRRYGNVNGKHSVRIAFTLTSTIQRTDGSETQDFQTTIGLQ
jgi:hypothetical protein